MKRDTAEESAGASSVAHQSSALDAASTTSVVFFSVVLGGVEGYSEQSFEKRKGFFGPIADTNVRDCDPRD